MTKKDIKKVLERVYQAKTPAKRDLLYLLSFIGKPQAQEIFQFADKVRKKFIGGGVLLRGIIEFSNVCNQHCLYCGLNLDNVAINRYRMTDDQILKAVEEVYRHSIRTIVLQSGEDDSLPIRLAELITAIKNRFDIAITLSVGERQWKDYRLWKNAGADRYLLKIETTNKKLYEKLNPGMSFLNRLRCLKDLKSLGYQVGSGSMVGLPGQTLEDIAGDIIFFKKYDFDMIGIRQFIPHPLTKLCGYKRASADLVLMAVALTRIVTRNTHLPATTALGSLEKDFRPQGLMAGANVIMPNFTPLPYKKYYEIYPDKRCISEPAGACGKCVEGIALSIGRVIDYSKGDSVKSHNLKVHPGGVLRF